MVLEYIYNPNSTGCVWWLNYSPPHIRRMIQRPYPFLQALQGDSYTAYN